MRRFVNGVEVELETSEAKVSSLDGKLYVRTQNGTESALAVRVGDAVHVSFRGRQFVVEKATRSSKRHGGPSSGEILAPMPGAIIDVLVELGQHVSKGHKVLVLEAMKTQQAFTAPFDGEVVAIGVVKGEQVADGQLLAKIQPSEV